MGLRDWVLTPIQTGSLNGHYQTLVLFFSGTMC